MLWLLASLSFKSLFVKKTISSPWRRVFIDLRQTLRLSFNGDLSTIQSKKWGTKMTLPERLHKGRQPAISMAQLFTVIFCLDPPIGPFRVRLSKRLSCLWFDVGNTLSVFGLSLYIPNTKITKEKNKNLACWRKIAENELDMLILMLKFFTLILWKNWYLILVVQRFAKVLPWMI